MPRNPSKKQKEASRKNLKGHYGPKTAKGKIASARNGRLNKGVKSAKARARVIAGRWKNSQTFYSFAGCLHCDKPCRWPGFTPKTPFRQLPLSCLQDVLRENPDRCFYYFKGTCCLDTTQATESSFRREICLLNVNFLKELNPKVGNVEQAEQLELLARQKSISYKKEILGYITYMGYRTQEYWSPRMKHMMGYYRNATRRLKFCKLEPWRTTYRDLDETLARLLEQS